MFGVSGKTIPFEDLTSPDGFETSYDNKMSSVEDRAYPSSDNSPDDDNIIFKKIKVEKN